MCDLGTGFPAPLPWGTCPREVLIPPMSADVCSEIIGNLILLSSEILEKSVPKLAFVH